MVTFGSLTRLWYQSGWVGAPLFVAATTQRSRSRWYATGFVRLLPVRAPFVVSRRSWSPKWPTPLPPFAWNSSTIALFQSAIALPVRSAEALDGVLGEGGINDLLHIQCFLLRALRDEVLLSRIEAFHVHLTVRVDPWEDHPLQQRGVELRAFRDDLDDLLLLRRVVPVEG